MPPRAWVERAYNVVRWTQKPEGGHFAASEEPEVFATDVREFVAPFESKRCAKARELFRRRVVVHDAPAQVDESNQRHPMNPRTYPHWVAVATIPVASSRPMSRGGDRTFAILPGRRRPREHGDGSRGGFERPACRHRPGRPRIGCRQHGLPPLAPRRRRQGKGDRLGMGVEHQ